MKEILQSRQGQFEPAGISTTIGLDLGDRWSFYCVLDEAGKIILDSNFRKALYSGLFVNMNFEDFV